MLKMPMVQFTRADAQTITARHNHHMVYIHA
jgi:hypothetical protein